MKCSLLLAALALTSLACFAQEKTNAYSKAFEDCDTHAKSQSELNKCAGEEARRNDAEMNAVLSELLTLHKGNKRACDKIRALQHAFLAYRHDYVEAMYPEKDKQAQYGSVFPMEADLVYASLTKTHTAALKNILDTQTEHH